MHISWSVFKQMAPAVRKELEQELITAAAEGDLDRVKTLVNRKHVNPDAISKITTPLAHAADAGHLAVVTFLVNEARANPNQARPDMVTPLLVAAENGHETVVEFLLFRNANPNQADKLFRTPLGQASDQHERIVTLLLQAKASPNIPDWQGVTPLMCASDANKISIAELLLKHGACKNAVNKARKIAADYATTEVMRTLLTPSTPNNTDQGILFIDSKQ